MLIFSSFEQTAGQKTFMIIFFWGGGGGRSKSVSPKVSISGNGVKCSFGCLISRGELLRGCEIRAQTFAQLSPIEPKKL